MVESNSAETCLTVGQTARLVSGCATIKLNSGLRIRCTEGAALITLRSGTSVWHFVLFDGECYNGSRAATAQVKALFGGCAIQLERRTF